MHARVATFEGGDADSVRKMVDEIKSRAQDGPPEGVPATEFLVLHSSDGSKVLAVTLFDSEEDLKKGDETLSAMDPPVPGALGQRTSVDLMEVGLRVQAERA
jgi:hypothetical protein